MIAVPVFPYVFVDRIEIGFRIVRVLEDIVERHPPVGRYIQYVRASRTYNVC